MFNPVCKVRFQGWESSTLELQRAGWQLSVQQDPYRKTCRLALAHNRGWYAMTNDVSFARLMPLLTAGPGVIARDNGDLLTFDVVAFNSRVHVQMIALPHSGALKFTAVDAFPIERQWSEVSMADLVPFRAVNPDAEQIIVAPESVPQVLDLLLKCQAPAAAARRQRWHDAAKIQAQVLIA